MTIHNKTSLSAEQVQRWLMEAGISDFQYYQAIQKAERYKEAIEKHIESTACKVKVSVTEYIEFLIVNDN